MIPREEKELVKLVSVTERRYIGHFPRHCLSQLFFFFLKTRMVKPAFVTLCTTAFNEALKFE